MNKPRIRNHKGQSTMIVESTAQAVGRSGRTGCSAFFRTKYRIVKDGYAGYEAQFKRWWFPVWMQCGFCNTSGTVEMARKICDLHAHGGVVEEYLPNAAGQTPAAKTGDDDGIL